MENFGCRATQADAAAIERQLLDRGYIASRTARGADVVVVNTCTVTASADAQARQAIRATHRANPRARILVTGCYAQRAPEELVELEGVCWVVGNSHKPQIPDLVEQMCKRDTDLTAAAFVPLAELEADPLSLARAPAKILTGDILALTAMPLTPVAGGEGAHSRPTLKIQDGCNSRCAYCVIPYVRGRSRSLPPDDVLREIRRLSAAGYREVVLSGINLGSYGRDLAPRIEFGDLLRHILDETPLERLRISSIEPMDVTRDLIELVASTDRVAQHFHIPLQSGSDRILAAMHRRYRAAQYARRIELIRELLPEAGIGADVIVAFPGETDADHRATVELVRKLPFTYLHVFPFSKRPGTEAAKLSDEVSPEVTKRRSKEVRALASEKSAAFRAAQLGGKLRVLTLNRNGNGPSGPWTAALSSNYLEARVRGCWPANQMLDVRITASDPFDLLGEVLDSESEGTCPEP
ncbi:MAG TPA: tRNA (N(6)-L-threonylcarbamoyladenosine(37)-C(2))-methylthiotransferase MtaB [Candidatus Acidoferrales bacterium]|nr:tRNA (N(6)-L-threonylcarbamoyladenosine(37)-C(2))-methylthiotransferase MtaB [Candidatus Acidoferrales bacterium]